MTIGRVLYDNLLRDPDLSSLTYDGTEVVGFEKENAIDWRDWSLFRVEGGVGTTTLEAKFGDDHVLDSASWYIKEPTETLTMRVLYESLPAFFTLLAEFTSLTDPLILLKTFDEVTLLSGRRLRFEFNDPVGVDQDVRQVAAGTVLAFPIGQHQGIAPPNLRGEFVVSNTIGVNGSFLGRDKVRADLQGEIDLEFVAPQTWVRDEWIPLMEHAERFAFFYAWDLDGFPDEVVFAWARSTPRPSNTGPSAKMTTNLPWSALAT